MRGRMMHRDGYEPKKNEGRENERAGEGTKKRRGKREGTDGACIIICMMRTGGTASLFPLKKGSFAHEIKHTRCAALCSMGEEAASISCLFSGQRMLRAVG